jgi:hypothetical protein
MAQVVRRSEQLNLSFPYDWSNPDISDEVLILTVLRRGIYEDICRVCAYFGFADVERLASHLNGAVGEGLSLPRMIDNIKKGFARAQARQSS